ncbi:MAG: chromosome segregation protein SMC [Anaerolineaceae bacterium]|nr:chromosome segregation protein SMC [Anaerolineaceae bacterium]
MEEKLASLELQGYKTFAKQSTMRFPARITAIIGPNGSGKSNVADGIRWVLGEQAYSILRAKKTEDMIYSGSELRSRAGMASVSIAFNNANGWLPIDYGEVVLTRRAYRDGQNEYLLNGQRVRLKDIHELLGKTGLGDHTYTIIGQGLVDVALSIKPDERRKLFEEAAGIGIYRTRKEEALKRLENSQRNLDRATDILDEIKPRLRSLERQAARFSEYQVIQENLEKDLRDWYGYHWYKAQQEISATKNDLLKAENDSSQVLERTQAQQNSLVGLKEKISEKHSRVNQFHQEMQALHESMQIKRQELAILNERNEALERSIQQLESDKENLGEIVGSDKKSPETLFEEISKLEDALKLAQTAKEEARQKLEATAREKQSLDRQRAELQNQLVATEKELVVFRSRFQDLQERAATLKNNSLGYTNSLAETEKEKHASQEKLEKAERELALLENDLKELDSERGQVSGEKDLLRQQTEQNMTQINRLNMEKNKASNRLDLLNQSQASLAGYSEGAKTLLKLSAEKKGPVMVDLASKLEIPQKYETAIAAALGEAIDLVVVQEGSTPAETLLALGSKVQDRVAITGQNWPAEESKQKSWQAEGVIGVASELIGKPAGLEPVLQRILGEYLVVSDMEKAEKARNENPRMNIVTLGGEVWLKNGLALIGKVKTSGKVSYLRTRKELENELEAVEAEFEKTRQISKSLDAQKQSLDAKLNEVNAKENALKQQFGALQQIKNTATLALAKINNQQDWLNRQIESSRKELDTSAENLARFKDSIEEKDQKAKSFYQEIEKIRVQQREKHTDELQQAFSNSETETKVLNQRLSLRQVNLKELEGRLKASLERLAGIEGRLEISKGNAKENTEKIALLRTDLDESTEKAKILQARSLDPEVSQLNLLEKELEGLLADEALTQKDLSNRERLVTHYQLELARQQEKLNALRARIDDDFGLIELEYRNAYATLTPLPFPDMVIETLSEVQELPETIDDEIRDLKAQIRRMGAINVEAQAEYQEVKQRFADLGTQIKDLTDAIADINKLIKELDEVMRTEFTNTFNSVAVEFSKMFSRLFNGGSAKLILSDNEDPIEGGIEIEARLPGKREQGLVLLSGGERSLTAVALVFALLKISPTPFCILDEVDAMLDESNVGRFIDLLKDLSNDTQFILITHNRNTVQAADVIYGITMGKDGASQLMSLRLDEVDDNLLK